jgi:hypothetical protein
VVKEKEEKRKRKKRKRRKRRRGRMREELTNLQVLQYFGAMRWVDFLSVFRVLVS